MGVMSGILTATLATALGLCEGVHSKKKCLRENFLSTVSKLFFETEILIQSQLHVTNGWGNSLDLNLGTLTTTHLT